MVIIYNKYTKEFIRLHGTNSKFHSGEFSAAALNLCENEDYINVPDDSDLANLIMSNKD